jgi:hypothetical protein
MDMESEALKMVEILHGDRELEMSDLQK